MNEDPAGTAGRIVLVTGAGRGLGREIAQAFARQGAIVAANDITPINLDVTIQGITAIGAQTRDYVADISKKMPAQNMVDQIIQDWGRIDILINNASVRPKIPLLEMDEWDWRRTLEVNLSGPFFMTQLVGRVMREQGGGVIINLACRDRCVLDSTGLSAFVASKIGLIGLTCVAAQELAEYSIRVHAILPPALMDRSASASHTKPSPGAEASALAQMAERKIVNLILYLCSPSAANLNGRIMDINDINELSE